MSESEDAVVTQPRTSELAIVAAICGIGAISNPFQGFALAIVAIVLGIRARSAIDASKGALSGSALGLTGLICGIVSLAFSVMYFGLVVLVFLGFILPMVLLK
jgi:hypothetical protein